MSVNNHTEEKEDSIFQIVTEMEISAVASHLFESHGGVPKLFHVKNDKEVEIRLCVRRAHVYRRVAPLGAS